ncbi:hamartin-like protein [Elsinoe australis]|uniref:Hamartin-like protein n=1 Tax=Elsinoe australis TaxID=40998 RepID=A0A4V6DVB6_9PEZI|nr:hamartin-like protein [Elsinoe australis]
MSGSSSDTVSLLSKTFAQAEISHDSLHHLRQALDTFAEKHKDPEETQSPKVQEELRKLYNDHVEADAPKLEAFMLSLTALEPYLRTTGDLQAWFDIAISTVVDLQGNKRSLLQQTQDFVAACVSFDKDEKDAEERSKTCGTFMSKLIDAYLKRTERLLKGDLTSDVRLQNRSQQQLQAMLVEVGRRHPQELFHCLEQPLTNPSTRFHTLQLMCAWLKSQQAHLDVIANTQVVDIVLKCLMNDRSTVMVSVALQCLLMLLPHIPAIVSSELPRLFLIYSRCLCWEKFSTTSSKAQRDLVTDDRLVNGSDDEQEEPFTIDPGWQTVASVPDALESAAPELLTYFTYLYGLYPVNFMSYVRKPRKYLKQINFPGAEHFDLDQNIIRKRTEQFQRAHLLHPSFFNMTAEEEITDGRWLKAEPSEVVAECLGLYSGNQPLPQSPGPAPSAKLPALPDSPTMSSRPAPISPIRLMSPNQDAEPPVSPTTSALAGSIESLTKASSVLNSDASFLQRELLVMRNELNFERYLKQQHVAAIGQLKRERIKAVTVEAETSSLYNANKRLQKKLDEANKFNEKLQKETQSRKTHARQSEDQLNAKIRTLRSGLADQAALETSLKKANGDIEILRELLSTSEARETRALARLEAQTEQLKEVETLKAEIAALKRELQAYKDRELDAGDMRAENELIKRDLEMTKSMVESRDQERERSKKAFQSKIADLESRLVSSNIDGSSSADQTQKALEESQAKVESIQRAWTETAQELQQLKLKYNDLIASNVSRANVDVSSSPVPFQAQDQQLWQGSPVGATYGQIDGYGRTMPMAVNGHGSSFPANRPLRQEAFDARLQQNYSPLSRSEGSSTHGGGVFLPGGWETTMATGSLPGSYIGGDNYSMVSGSIKSGERPRESSSAFSTTSEGSSLKSRDKITANSQVRVFGRGGAQNIKMKPKDNGEGTEKAGKKAMNFFKGLNS